ncbi:peptidoglycan DD-metalloendopeptidase family protein [Agromyces sp. NPDC056523]|uniref:peptidoglycan DD-metalloendopeptidase family protein n=1 Tax=Agromyces sp. NPDC056523 TaxID=3345850 RepID=UPI00366DF033
MDGADGEDRVTTKPIVLELPFRGRWLARNSPARRVPSHGTHALGTTYAIDFIAVDEHGRSAPSNWRSWLSVEPPESFVGFGRPILAPIAGTVVAAHDGEEDHEARRSQLTLVPYMLGQAGRLRAGPDAIAGNHVILALGPGGPYVALVHLRRGSVRVAVGDVVEVGDVLGECGNSGNSTQPHVHVQAADSLDWSSATGLPIAFRFRRAMAQNGDVVGLPRESEIVEPPSSADRPV